MAQQPNPFRTKTESTRAGEQHVIPGAEKVSDAEVAKRKAGEPLKPKAEQKPADEGLFGDGANRAILSTSPPSLEAGPLFNLEVVRDLGFLIIPVATAIMASRRA